MRKATGTLVGSLGVAVVSLALLASGVVTAVARDFDFGDSTSERLTTNAWKALEAQDWEAVEAYTQRCIDLYEKKALEMQAKLTATPPAGEAATYWALNDVATCYFIKGKALNHQGKKNLARDAFDLAIGKFSYAQAWDPKGWYWSVSSASKDAILTLEKGYDFGDYTSQTLTTKAWQALGAQDYDAVEAYAKKCIELYEDDATQQQASLQAFAPQDQVFNYWALNDVGTCYFILGEAAMAQRKLAEAKQYFQTVVDQLGYAQCWDPQGWFWKVAVGARGRINQVIAESP